MGTNIIITSAFVLEGAFYGVFFYGVLWCVCVFPTPNLKVAYIFVLVSTIPLFCSDIHEGFTKTEPRPVP